MNEKIVAIDIDDTITHTARQTFEIAKQHLPHPLTANELLRTYHQPGKVPEWYTAAATRWLDTHLGDPDFLDQMLPQSDALPNILSIAKKCSLGCYITSRTHDMQLMTVRWLSRYGFPQAPVITRDISTKEPNWKLKKLEAYFSQPVCLIDDMLGEFSEEEVTPFTGTLLWYNPHHFLKKNSRVIECFSWKDVSTQLMS